MNFLNPENPIFLRSTRDEIQERVTSGLTYLACFASVNVAS